MRENVLALDYESWERIPRDFSEPFPKALFPSACPLCKSPISVHSQEDDAGGWFVSQSCRLCLSCGWWSYTCGHEDLVEDEGYGTKHAVCVLKEFRLDDPKIPERILLKYLRSRPESLANIHHYSFEKVIRSIFREVHGYEAGLTKRTRDKGIDIYFFEKDQAFAAVQVKQKRDPKKPVGIDVIQRLAGAAYARGLNEIHLVTNARFSSDCYEEAKLLEQRMSVSLADFRDVADALAVLRLAPIEVDPQHPCPAWEQRLWDVSALNTPRPPGWLR